jgi:tetratricopeptide (TPR) repeat protein
MFFEVLRALACLLICCAYLAGQDSQPRPSCDFDKELAMAQGLLQARNYKDAVTAIEKLNRCSSPTPLQLFQIGWLYGRARHFKEALDIFESLPDDVPDRPSHQYAVALSKFELENYRGVVATLKPPEGDGGLSSESASLLAVSGVVTDAEEPGNRRNRHGRRHYAAGSDAPGHALLR